MPDGLEPRDHRNAAQPAPVTAGHDNARGPAAQLARPCNTAHHYAQSSTKAVSISPLGMVPLSVSAAQHKLAKNAKVVTHASPSVKPVEFFNAPLCAPGLSAM